MIKQASARLTVLLVLALLMVISSKDPRGYSVHADPSLKRISSTRPMHLGSASDPYQLSAAVAVNGWASNGPEGVQITSLAIDPLKTNIVYAGTVNGLFRSSDGGASWNKTGLPDSTVVSLAIDSSDTDILYAVSSHPHGSSVFKSTDGGASWQEADNGLKAYLNVLVLDPHDSNTLYVGSYYEGVFKSTDGGANWKQVNNQSLFGSNSIVIDPGNSNILYATQCDDFFGCFLLKSPNGGVDWKDTNNNLRYGPSTLAIDPRNSDVLYVDTYVEASGSTHPGVAKSTNGGASWTASDTGLFGYVNTLAVDSFNSATIYAGTYNGGVYKSTDGGASWGEFNAGLTNLNIGALAINPSGIDLHAGTSAGVFDYRYQTGCVDALSLTEQSFEFSGGTENVNVSAGSECSWSAISNAGWLNVTPDISGNGNGVASYAVAPHTTSTRSRITTLFIGGRSITITQAGPPLVITGASARHKTLYISGEKFDLGAVILLDGEEQKTKNDSRNSNGFLIAKKGARKIISGQSVKLQVRNTDGTLSPEFTFTRQ